MIEYEHLGRVYHLAKNEKEWKEAVARRSVGRGWSNGKGDYHHIAGRHGKLRWMVENGIQIPRKLHGLQKDLDFRKRVVFQKKIKSVVGADLYERLWDMRHFFKFILGERE